MSIPPPHVRLLIDPPQSGACNMAVDQALLESVAESRGVVLRFYQWAEPTLSLGYFQRLAARTEHPASRHAVVVRRASGGGAILHDRELTYSLAVPPDFSLRQTAGCSGAAAFYRAAHESLIAALADLGVIAELCGCSPREATRDLPFMCFARQGDGDVLVHGNKIAGSAQRRYRGAVLQHGSILLESSPAAPELPGILQLASVTLSPEHLVQLWLPHLAASLGLACRQSQLTASERARSQDLQRGRYETIEWTALK